MPKRAVERLRVLWNNLDENENEVNKGSAIYQVRHSCKAE